MKTQAILALALTACSGAQAGDRGDAPPLGVLVITDVSAAGDGDWFEIVNASDYYAGKVFEYPAMGEAANAYPRLPNLDVLIAAAQLLVQTLELPCKEA